LFFLSKEENIDLDLGLTMYREHDKELLSGNKMHTDIWDSFCRKVNKKIE